MKPDKLFMRGVLGDLDDQGHSDQGAFEELVRRNPETARRLAALRGAEAALHHDQVPAPPADLKARIMEAVKAQAASGCVPAGTGWAGAWRSRWAVVSALMGLAFGAIALGMAMITYGEPEIVRQAPWIRLQLKQVVGAAVIFSCLALFMHKGGRLGRWGMVITALGYVVALGFNAYMVWTTYGPGAARSILMLFLALVFVAGAAPVLGYLSCASRAKKRMGVTATADTNIGRHART